MQYIDRHHIVFEQMEEECLFMKKSKHGIRQWNIVEEVQL
jgi:hypothetical protein